jgi:hypothetical protein
MIALQDSAISSKGKNSEAGNPPAKEITPGCWVSLRISRMAEFCMRAVRDARYDDQSKPM